MERFITYGEERIVFSIGFSNASVKRLRIHVDPKGRVTVVAPAGASADAIVAAVRRRARWIWQRVQACHARVRHAQTYQYVSGECHDYLGRRYVLKVTLNPDEEPGVKLLHGKLEVSTPACDAAKVQALLDVWYRQRAVLVLAKRLSACVACIPWLEVAPPFRLLRMRRQWGSCSPSGDLVLNPALVKAPVACIDAVIFHELCHLREHNHSPRFYALLDRVLPDWRQRKSKLDDLAERLLGR